MCKDLQRSDLALGLFSACPVLDRAFPKTSLVVQCSRLCTSNIGAKGTGLISGWGTEVRMLHVACCGKKKKKRERTRPLLEPLHRPWIPRTCMNEQIHVTHTHKVKRCCVILVLLCFFIFNPSSNQTSPLVSRVWYLSLTLRILAHLKVIMSSRQIPQGWLFPETLYV